MAGTPQARKEGGKALKGFQGEDTPHYHKRQEQGQEQAKDNLPPARVSHLSKTNSTERPAKVRTITYVMPSGCFQTGTMEGRKPKKTVHAGYGTEINTCTV